MGKSEQTSQKPAEPSLPPEWELDALSEELSFQMEGLDALLEPYREERDRISGRIQQQSRELGELLSQIENLKNFVEKRKRELCKTQGEYHEVDLTIALHEEHSLFVQNEFAARRNAIQAGLEGKPVEEPVVHLRHDLPIVEKEENDFGKGILEE